MTNKPPIPVRLRLNLDAVQVLFRYIDGRQMRIGTRQEFKARALLIGLGLLEQANVCTPSEKRKAVRKARALMAKAHSEMRKPVTTKMFDESINFLVSARRVLWDSEKTAVLVTPKGLDYANRIEYVPPAERMRAAS